MSKTTKFIVSILLIAIIALSFATGYELGGRSYLKLGKGLDTVGQAWNIIFNEYVERERLDTRAMSGAAIEGMVKELDDPYTSYLDTKDYQLGVSSLEGEFDGIGAYVTIKDKQLMIIAPIADSPADMAGIKAGDKILEINGQPTSDMGLAEAVLNIRGSRGTSVRLLIIHEGDTEPVEIEVIRAKVEVPSVRFEMKGDIAYIRITQFSERTDLELSPMLQNIADEGARGIILDLRSNPGGLLEVVIDVASHFLHEGILVNVVSNQEKLTALEVKSGEIITDLPMVVLVDSYSASGSEVLAGALQDYGRAAISGNTTYGKGSVNVLRQLEDGSGLYITTARWLTPNGRLIEGKGIEPDFKLELSGEDAVQWAIDYLTSNQQGKK